MKKLGIILLMAALFSCNDTQAQITLYKAPSAILPATTSSNSADTITNTGTTYFTSRAGDLNKYSTSSYKAYFTLLNLTGTPATVTAIQEGSMDGVNWYPINSNAMGVDGYNSDSLSITPTTSAVQFNVSSTSGATKFVYGVTKGSQSSRLLYYRIKFVGSGTQTVRIHTLKLIPFTH